MINSHRYEVKLFDMKLWKNKSFDEFIWICSFDASEFCLALNWLDWMVVARRYYVTLCWAIFWQELLIAYCWLLASTRFLHVSEGQFKEFSTRFFII